MMLVSARSNALGDAGQTWCGIEAMQSAALGWSLPNGGTMTLGLVHVSMPSRRSMCVGEFLLLSRPGAPAGTGLRGQKGRKRRARPHAIRFSCCQRRDTESELASPSKRARRRERSNSPRDRNDIHSLLRNLARNPCCHLLLPRELVAARARS